MMGCHSGWYCLGCSLSLPGILSLEVDSRQPPREAHVIELGNGSSDGCQQPQEGTEGGSSQDDYMAPAHILKGSSESEAPSLAAPGFLTHRSCKIINLCCFQPLSFGVICFIVIDN